MERFWSKVDVGLCWEWKAAVDGRGYGAFKLDGRQRVAHRVAWELLVGPIPEGLHIDHLCRNHRCVNPDHLEPVTCAENVRRGVLTQRQRVKTHCPRGHRYDVENTYTYTNKKGWVMRSCKKCNRDEQRRRRHHVQAYPITP